MDTMNIRTAFTIGHSTHEIDEFLRLLEVNQIDVVADVRSSPYSRFNPQFNRDSLKSDLASRSIRYVYLGKELGARSDDPSCYEDGRVQYGRLAKTELFRSGIERLMHGISEYRVALMCAEKEPLDCHRTILVSQALAAEGVQVVHILEDGAQELHDKTLNRLFELLKLPSEDLFLSREALLADAVSRQERKIAYVKEEDEGNRDEEAA